MGKNIIQQARGKGGPRYRSPGFKFVGAAKLRTYHEQDVVGMIVDLVHCPGHSAPLMMVEYEDGVVQLGIAPEGVRVGDTVAAGPSAEVRSGSTLPLSSIPEGTPIFNIESVPGDGGKMVRTSGVSAKIFSKQNDKIIVILPSKKKKTFNPQCRAQVGIVAGKGRTEKPFLKAGVKHHAKKARNKLYPRVRGAAQNAVDHPYGNKRTSRKSKARPVSRHAPPGKKVGMIAARRTGRKKR